MTTSWQGASPLTIVGAIGLSRPSSTFCRIDLLVGLERQQRLVAVRIDAADQRKLGAVVVEAHRRPALLVGLLQRLADVGQRDRPVDIDQLALLAQHVEELAKILIRHCDLRLVPPAPADGSMPPSKKRGLGTSRRQLCDEATSVAGTPGRGDGAAGRPVKGMRRTGRPLLGGYCKRPEYA